MNGPAARGPKSGSPRLLVGRRRAARAEAEPDTGSQIVATRRRSRRRSRRGTGHIRSVTSAARSRGARTAPRPSRRRRAAPGCSPTRTGRRRRPGATAPLTGGRRSDDTLRVPPADGSGSRREPSGPVGDGRADRPETADLDHLAGAAADRPLAPARHRADPDGQRSGAPALAQDRRSDAVQGVGRLAVRAEFAGGVLERAVHRPAAAGPARPGRLRHPLVPAGTTDDVRDQVFKFLHIIFDTEVADDLVGNTVNTILDNGRSDVVSVGLIISFWAGSSAMSAFVESITIAYCQHEVRHPVAERFFALFLYLIALFAGHPAAAAAGHRPRLPATAVPAGLAGHRRRRSSTSPTTRCWASG